MKIKTCILTLSLFVVACYTQFKNFLSVPGLHFDEAWQAMLAHQIATEEGFFPFSAMNSYTSPILHYLLALVFHFTNPNLEVLRGFLGGINLLTLFLIFLWIWFLNEKKTAWWFLLLWALLPLSVHNHRFYIEVTVFHGFCFSLLLWGLFLWNKKPSLSFGLLSLSTLAGIYSHILYVAVFLSGLFILARSFPQEFRSLRNRMLIALICILTTPITLRMGIELKKSSPFLLLLLLLSLAIISIFYKNIWNRFPRFAIRSTRWIFFIVLPFLLIYVAMFWNGFWPYAQATGHLKLWWLPINVLVFLSALLLQYTKRLRTSEHQAREKWHLIHSIMSDLHHANPLAVTWKAFLIMLFLMSLLIFKPSPRYYMIPTILAMLWCSQRLARIHSKKIIWIVAFCFFTWNLFCFEKFYINQFEKAGPVNSEFKLWIFHDSGRDFRPIQKTFNWLIQHNCQHELQWTENDRFLLPLRFLQLRAPTATGVCPWSKEELFLSTMPDPTNPNLPPYEHVKFLAHEKTWGDLAFWLRKSIKYQEHLHDVNATKYNEK